MVLTGQQEENLYFEDRFARADSATVGDPWTTTGTLAVENGALHQTDGAGAVAAATALIDTNDLPEGVGKAREVFMGCMVACADDSSARTVSLVLRAADSTMTDAYMVRLQWSSDVATLSIVKRTGGSNATAATATVTTEMETVSSSYDNVFQRLSGRLVEKDGGITVEAYLNDEERPRLTATDSQQPMHTVISHIGVRLGDNDAGVGGHVFCKNFFVQGIAEVEQDFDYAVPTYWTLGELIKRSRALALRDSSDLTGGEDWLTYANMAYQEYYDAIGRPDWAEQDYTFVIKASVAEHELPPWVDNHDDSVRVGNNVWPILNERTFRDDYAALDDTETGSPYLFRRGGRGPLNGLILKPYPVPSTDTTCKIRVFRRPGWMSDLATPLMLPDNECYRLLSGVIHMYVMSDGPRDKTNAWTMKWQQHLRHARRTNTRRDKVGARRILRPGTFRGQITGIDGRTRFGQWRR